MNPSEALSPKLSGKGECPLFRVGNPLTVEPSYTILVACRT
jgi:hypothetical protein